MVFGRVWGFLKWHKKKFIALGTLSALGVGGYYYAKRMLLDGMRQVEELGRGLQEKMMESQHRQTELARIRDECARMISTFLPPLRATVKQLTDPKPVTEKLKQVRMKRRSVGPGGLSAEQDDQVKVLWDELKVVSLTRLIASVYSLALLNAVLRLQLHVLGRTAFEEAAEQRRAMASNPEASGGSSSALEDSGKDDGDDDGGEESSKITRKVRERFLFSGSDHLMNSGEGMRELVDRVHSSIKEVTKDWVMGTDATVTRWEILNMMDAIRAKTEGNAPSASDGLRLGQDARSWSIRCLIPQDESSLLEADRELDDEQNKLCREMLEETLDMIESPFFSLVLEQSFDKLFDVLRKDLQNRPFDVFSSASSGGQEQEERFLLTKVIVNLKLVASQVLSEKAGDDADEENPFEEALTDIRPLDDLCGLVFQQGADEGGSGSPLDAFGLGDDDLQSLAGLLGTLGGTGVGAGGMPSEQELMKLLAGGLGGGGGGPGGPGGDDAQFAQMMSLLGGGPPGPGVQTSA